ncbi:MAG: Inosose isomerase [Candidatus Moanabacter tarae]|uniref:Inosose isomerase n=1 Tax=Candidatus Moanibacter tarae TaxID=2200854 RepID=A0A2Z4AFK5_9BACT|nr:MAG: Inosose isomerase [Candidatus Moanabacter tarae]
MFKSLSLGAIGIKRELEEGLGLANQAGFQGFDIDIGEVAGLVEKQGADFVTDLFVNRDLRMGSWGLPVLWNGTDEEYSNGLAKLSEFAKIASKIGANRAILWIPSGSNDRKFIENFRWHVHRLRPISVILQEYGCRLGLEFIGPRSQRVGKQYGFIYTIGGMLALCEAIGTDNVGLLLDSWHWHTSLGAIEDLRSLKAENIVHVHVNDAPYGVGFWDFIDHERGMPSATGVIDLIEFLKTLKDIGYDGPVSPEPFNSKLGRLPVEQAVSEIHESLEPAWQAAGI